MRCFATVDDDVSPERGRLLSGGRVKLFHVTRRESTTDTDVQLRNNKNNYLKTSLTSIDDGLVG